MSEKQISDYLAGSREQALLNRRRLSDNNITTEDIIEIIKYHIDIAVIKGETKTDVDLSMYNKNMIFNLLDDLPEIFKGLKYRLDNTFATDSHYQTNNSEGMKRILKITLF